MSRRATLVDHLLMVGFSRAPQVVPGMLVGDWMFEGLPYERAHSGTARKICRICRAQVVASRHNGMIEVVCDEHIAEHADSLKPEKLAAAKALLAMRNPALAGGALYSGLPKQMEAVRICQEMREIVDEIFTEEEVVEVRRWKTPARRKGTHATERY